MKKTAIKKLLLAFTAGLISQGTMQAMNGRLSPSSQISEIPAPAVAERTHNSVITPGLEMLNRLAGRQLFDVMPRRQEQAPAVQEQPNENDRHYSVITPGLDALNRLTGRQLFDIAPRQQAAEPVVIEPASYSCIMPTATRLTVAMNRINADISNNIDTLLARLRRLNPEQYDIFCAALCSGVVTTPIAAYHILTSVQAPAIRQEKLLDKLIEALQNLGARRSIFEDTLLESLQNLQALGDRMRDRILGITPPTQQIEPNTLPSLVARSVTSALSRIVTQFPRVAGVCIGFMCISGVHLAYNALHIAESYRPAQAPEPAYALPGAAVAAHPVAERHVDANEAEESECAICQDAIPSHDNNLRVLTCAHTFHADCINRWFATQRTNHHALTCPTCRRVQQ